MSEAPEKIYKSQDPADWRVRANNICDICRPMLELQQQNKRLREAVDSVIILIRKGRQGNIDLLASLLEQALEEQALLKETAKKSHDRIHMPKMTLYSPDQVTDLLRENEQLKVERDKYQAKYHECLASCVDETCPTVVQLKADLAAEKTMTKSKPYGGKF